MNRWFILGMCSIHTSLGCMYPTMQYASLVFFMTHLTDLLKVNTFLHKHGLQCKTTDSLIIHPLGLKTHNVVKSCDNSLACCSLKHFACAIY